MESNSNKKAADTLIKDIRRKTHRIYSSEEKIRIVIEGMRGEESIVAAISIVKLHKHDRAARQGLIQITRN